MRPPAAATPGHGARDYSEGGWPASSGAGGSAPVLLGDRRRRRERGDQLPRAGQIGAALELVGDLLRRLQPLHVPGVEFAQITLGPLAAEMLLGAVDHPEPLGDDLLAARRRNAPAGQFLEDPWVAERAAGDHHRGGAGLLVGAAGGIGA